MFIRRALSDLLSLIRGCLQEMGKEDEAEPSLLSKSLRKWWDHSEDKELISAQSEVLVNIFMRSLTATLVSMS